MIHRVSVLSIRFRLCFSQRRPCSLVHREGLVRLCQQQRCLMIILSRRHAFSDKLQRMKAVGVHALVALLAFEHRSCLGQSLLLLAAAAHNLQSACPDCAAIGTAKDMLILAAQLIRLVQIKQRRIARACQLPDNLRNIAQAQHLMLCLAQAELRCIVHIRLHVLHRRQYSHCTLNIL